MPQVCLTARSGGAPRVLAPRARPRAASLWLGGIWMLGLTLLPVYVGMSGGVQPGHAVLAVAAFATLASHAVKRDELWLAMCLLDAVVVTRCSWEVLATGDLGELTAASFFLFNTIVVLALRAFIERDDGMQFVGRGIVAALIVGVAGVFVFGVRESIGTNTRISGTFNNPNQLGYFSTCIGSLLAAAYFRGYLSMHGLCIGLLAGGFLATVSLSKAAMLSSAIGVGFLALGFRRSSLGLIVGSLALLATLILLMSSLESGMLDDVPVVQRLRLIGNDSDDSLEARGYGLMVSDEPLVILFGRGYGEVFDALGHEVHSTIGSIWVGYGAVGWLAFVGLLGVWCRSLHARHGLLRTLTVAAPPLLYGLTHNGSRATIFWVLMAVSHAMVFDAAKPRAAGCREPRNSRESPASNSRVRSFGLRNRS